MYVQGCGNIEATAKHVHVFSTLLSCSIYTFVLSIHVHTCTYMYSLVSVYQTFTRFIEQCPASLAVFSPMCTCIYMYMYMHLQCTCIHTCTVYMYVYVSPYSNSNYMYVQSCTLCILVLLSV